MKRFLSFILAFVMVVTTFVGIIPPLEVSATTTGASFTSLKASSTKVYEGDSVQISGTAKRSGNYYLRAIQINVRNEGDDDHGFRVDRVDFEASEKKTSYSLSKLDSLEIGSYTCSGCGEKETLGVGKHRIDVSIGVYDSNGNKADTAGITQSIWIEVLEEEAPYVKSIAADVDGTEVEFTVKTNLTAKHGIVLYADGYELDMIDWDDNTYSSYIKYTGSHVFNQVGEREITVYALDADGNIVNDSEDTITIEIDSFGQCDAPTITTSNNQQIEVGNSFTISWNKPSTPTGVTFKYNVYVWDGTNNTLVSENLTTTTCTIPASKLSKAGTYVISVIAMATGYTQSDDDDASINLNVIVKETVEKVTLTTPRVSGSTKIQYGDDYTISWDFDAQVDYYQITIDGLNYKKAVNATEKSFTIPGSVFKQYSGADTNYTISLVAMSHDTEKYLPSEAATIRVNVAGYSESNALIKSAEILDGNEIIAGTVVRFKIVTTKDVTALRMKDGAGSFIVNTWYASEIGTNSSNAQYYKDSGNERTWYVQQKVNHAGDANAAGAKRLLTFYSMVNEVEYNNCSVSFYCKKGNDVIGKFEITSPFNNAMLPSGKDIVITWSAPTNTTVDYYIVDVYHGDIRVDRATVTATTYTLSGTLLEKDSVAWQIRVTARKNEGQWAESVATASFKLECTHEHLGQPTENVLSYTQKNDTVHSCVVEKTYACLDCGLANAKKVQETVTKSHNWIALDKGGNVCNQCWHLQSDGSFTVKKDMQLSSLAGNREFVYWGVDAFGNPANKQNGRYVDKSDKITILGEVGNCYLIEYPIPGGVHWGFIAYATIEEDVKIDLPDMSGYDYSEIKNAVDDYLKAHKVVGLITPEYSLAESIIREKAPAGSGLQAFLTYLDKDQLDNVWWIITNVTTDGKAEIEKQTKAGLYLILDNMISDTVNDCELDDMADDLETINKQIKSVRKTMGNTKKLYNLTTEVIYQYDPELANCITQMYLDIMNVEKFPSNKPLSELILGVKNNWKKIDTSLKYTALAFESIAELCEIAYIRNNMSLVALDVIEKAFQENVASGGDDEYNKAMLKAVKEVRAEIESNLVAGARVFAENIVYNFGKAGAKSIITKGLKAIGKKSIMSAISIYDTARSTVLNVSGLSSYIKASNDSYYIACVGGILDNLYFDYAIKYHQSGFTMEEYSEFYYLHNIMQGVQISLNEVAIKLSDSAIYDERLEKEIEHLRNCTLLNWEYNPYATGNNGKPDLSWINSSPNATVYQLLLDSSYERSCMFKYWDNMLVSEQNQIFDMVSTLEDLSKSPFVSIYILNTKEYESITNIHDRNSILLVNAVGDGLLLESRAPNGWLANQLSFCVLSKSQITQMLGDNASNNILPSDTRFSPVYLMGYRDNLNYSCIIGEPLYKEYISESLKLYVDAEDINIIVDYCIPTLYQENDSWLIKNAVKALESVYSVGIRVTKLSLIRDKLQIGEYKQYAWKNILEDN